MVEIETTVRLPADWESHTRSWIIWPYQEEFSGEQICKIKACLKQLVQTILKYEPVTVIVRPEDADEIQNVFDFSSEIAPDIEIHSTELTWARDFMPLFVEDGKGGVTAIGWHFNAWSKKSKSNHEPYTMSDWFSEVTCETVNTSSINDIDKLHSLGCIQSDGEGTLLVTKQNMLEEYQDDALTEADIESILKRELGAEKVIWLENGIWGDNLAQGHVSGLASFASPGVVVTMFSEDSDHPNTDAFSQNKQILTSSTDAKGRLIEVIEIPQPMTVLWEDKPLPLSYVNFYPVKGAILVPVFDDPHDEKALEVYRTLFPNLDVVAIEALPFFRNGGGLHSLLAPQPSIQ
ncbi:agmatine deiminase family protein [Marinomonas balearica]|uniref:Agmatine deiminase n=1 Tax=Marinomonas balearica TaxID=491947 RepID=A0A4R6ME24_9GAMM|nr:agmatine deiminase family protein [Marinomonas balearica]TDO99676.1 agmatine deiminase [Marinomonas balearica]